jgi:hypothetical protein
MPARDRELINRALNDLTRQILCPAISLPCEERTKAFIVVVSDHGVSFLD